MPKRLAQYLRYEKRFLEAGLQGVFIRRFYRNRGFDLTALINPSTCLPLTVMTFPGTPDHESHEHFPLLLRTASRKADKGAGLKTNIVFMIRDARKSDGHGITTRE